VYALIDHAGNDLVPEIDPEAWIHPDAVVIGRVRIGAGSTVWPTAVLRGDHGEIRIGEQTSIQDGVVVHCTATLPPSLGSQCVVGHRAHLEGCTVEDGCLIGSGSILLHRVVVRSGALVAAGAVVTPGTEVPHAASAMGVPATVRPGTVAPGAFEDSVRTYVANGPLYRRGLRRLD
jgi:carbonic anhydrase/acetyltransferase-like protein (isoleucine patch superfamily)